MKHECMKADKKSPCWWRWQEASLSAAWWSIFGF